LSAPAKTDALKLAPFTAKDAKALAALHGRCFPRPWKAEDFRRYADMSAYPGLLAWIGSELAGFVIVSIAGDEAEILTLGTDSALRRRGVASALLTRMIENVADLGATAVFLEVGVGNAGARALYERHGFVSEGLRKGYYDMPDGPQDAVVMKRTLRDP
jgi:ribosomal-protein-alanine N-acetyltransferase